MLKMTEYAKRRKTLMQKIGPKSIVILPAAKEFIRNGDAHYPFRQNSDFYYLSGFNEPDAMLVLAPNREEGEYILFNRVRDKEREIWDGPRVGQEGAVKEYLADQAFPIQQFKPMLATLLEGRRDIHYPIGIYKDLDKLIMNALNKVRAKIRGGFESPAALVDIATTLHEMRLFKSPEEIAIMQTAVDISKKAHIHAMQACRPGMNEYELEAEITYQFQKHGAKFPAYTSIVGAGRNSCILHYIANDQVIKEQDIVLIDAGAEYQNYASDITRTFPANGKFSEEQRAVYEVVLKAQLAGIKAVKPGAPFIAAQTAIVDVIVAGLIDLGILKGKKDTLIEQQAYLPYYMHRSGHWLGLDVHDAGRYKVDDKWRKLEPGMTLTVEPGIYLSADVPGLNKRWHNIGVRIEDDVLVTKNGNEVLSAKIPKEIKDVEDAMAK